MSIICALRRGGETWIGSDRQAVAGGSHIASVARQKWVLSNNCALGMCGAMAFLDAFEHFSEQFRADWDGHEVWAWTRKIIIELGAEPETKKGDPPWFDCSLIFVTPERVIRTGACGGSTDFVGGEFCSQGSGDEFACGAVHAAEALGETDPRRLLDLAIGAACQFDTGCGGEPWIHCLKGA